MLKTLTPALTGLLLTLGLAIGGCDNSSSTPAAGPTTQSAGKSLHIAVIPKGTTHVFWKSVEAGAQQAADDLGVQMTWKGPLSENDRAQQIQIVEQFIGEGVDGIVLAPLDDTALLRPVQTANANDIPVVIIDSALQGQAGTDFVSFVATDNREGGRMAGRELARLLDGKGKVAMLRYQEGSASTHEREEGFLDIMKEHPQIEVIIENRYAGPTIEDAQTQAMQMIDRIREADGLFAPNEPTTNGLLNTLSQSGMAGQKKFVGFDASDELIDALNAGRVNALVAQNPRKMGYEGMAAMVKHLRGEEVPQRIDSGAKLITPENLNDPDTQAILGKS